MDQVAPRSRRNKLTSDQLIDLYKFYEDAAQKTKTHAWTQSAWMLGLNGAILAFSLKVFVERASTTPGLLELTWWMALAGLILSGYLVYALYELGKHISGYWASADRIVSQLPPLMEIINPGPSGKRILARLMLQLAKCLDKLKIAMMNEKVSEASDEEKGEKKKKNIPPFVKRLMLPPVFFAISHVAWAFYVTKELVVRSGHAS